ncbi:NUDIX hydrolase [Colwellia sp. E2M01]|uniref:NUDIX hydrolase n=1 Tax=Colwellia sp. E2M01 TaxID=2841561 RepID=UPI002091CBAF|nr:NUDIX hydrolase [Colwellia sp. E2M01]
MLNEINEHGESQFKPNTTVAAVIHHQGKFLFVEELENNNIVFNQPAGHLEKGESLIAAIEREVLEETGLALSPDYLCGIYYHHRPDLALYFLRFCFVIELDQYLKGQPQDVEILATHWFSLTQIKEKHNQLRSAMVLECIEDYLAGNKIELSQLKSNL